MSTLSDEVKDAFNNARNQHDNSPLMVTNPDVELAPAFVAMREYYNERLLVQLRRSYRHFAGSTMPTAGDELITLTSTVVAPRVVMLVSRTFSDGVMIGQKQDLQVKMGYHFGTLSDLFEREQFRSRSDTMAKGFLSDSEVSEFLVDYFTQALDMLAHYTGFAHSQADPAKIWDLWNLASAAVITTAYVSGYKLGQTWAERDTLDGIVIASTEGGTNDAGGEAGDDR